MFFLQMSHLAVHLCLYLMFAPFMWTTVVLVLKGFTFCCGECEGTVFNKRPSADPSGHPDSSGGRPEVMHRQTLWGRRASLLFWSGFTHQVSLSPQHNLTTSGEQPKNKHLEQHCIHKAQTHSFSWQLWCLCPRRSCMMQADSEKLRQAWIKAVQNSIATAFRDKGDNSEVKAKLTGVGLLKNKEWRISVAADKL